MLDNQDGTKNKFTYKSFLLIVIVQVNNNLLRSQMQREHPGQNYMCEEINLNINSLFHYYPFVLLFY